MRVGLIAYLIYIIIFVKYKEGKTIQKANYVIITLLVLNIFVISASLYFPRGKGYVKEFLQTDTAYKRCNTVSEKIPNFDKAIEYIKANDKDFYRISKKERVYQNLSLIYDFNPIQLFLSLGNKHVYNLSCSLEDNCYSSTMCVNGADRRTKFTTLIANKYYICKKEDYKYVPYGYTLYHEIEDTMIYINKNYLPVGIMYDSYITKEQFKRLTPLEKEDALITTAMIECTDKIKGENNGAKINKPITLNYTQQNNKINNNTIQITKNNEEIELIIENIPKNSELYLSINNLEYISERDRTDFSIKTQINGISNSEKVENYTSSAYYMKNPNFLINLGITEEKQDNKLKLTFNKTGTYIFDSLKILAVSMDEYERKIDKLKANVMDNINYGNNYISGTVNTMNGGILQIATSYSDGWKVFIDGKEQKILKVNEAFIGTFIEKGEHKVEFFYETPYLKLGALLSVIGTILFIGMIFLEKNRKNIL